MTFRLGNMSFPIDVPIVNRSRHPCFLLLNLLSKTEVLLFRGQPHRDLLHKHLIRGSIVKGMTVLILVLGCFNVLLDRHIGPWAEWISPRASC